MVDFLTVGFYLEAVGLLPLKTNVLTCMRVHIPHRIIGGPGFAVPGIFHRHPGHNSSLCRLDLYWGLHSLTFSCLGFISLPRAPL